MRITTPRCSTPKNSRIPSGFRPAAPTNLETDPAVARSHSPTWGFHCGNTHFLPPRNQGEGAAGPSAAVPAGFGPSYLTSTFPAQIFSTGYSLNKLRLGIGGSWPHIHTYVFLRCIYLWQQPISRDATPFYFRPIAPRTKRAIPCY